MIRFNADKKLKIMHITDIQEIPKVSPDTLNLLNAALESEKPDLVILTGDQIKGYGLNYKKSENPLEAVRGTIEKIMQPITSRNIPFAVTFGNHDAQSGVSNEEQLCEIYKRLPGCIFNEENNFNAGTFNIPVYESSSDKTAFNIYLMDSQGDKKGGGYECPEKEQIDWYKKTRDEMKNENGRYIPSILFQHIPLCEYYNLLEKTGRLKKGAVRAYRTHKNQWYILGEDCFEKGDFLEPPSIPDENCGEFDAISEKKDVIAVFVGHDHKNSFSGVYKNILMGYTPCAGFNEYGNGVHRGVRIIELDENDALNFKTRVITYSALGFKKLNAPFKDFLYRHFPASLDEAVILFRNIFICIFVFSAIIMFFLKAI